MVAVLVFAPGIARADLPDTVERIKPSVVAVATFEPTRNPQLKYLGTGFVVGNGNFIATNAHVLPNLLDPATRETLAIVQSMRPDGARRARVLARDEEHDLALLEIDGPPMPALKLGDTSKVREGQEVAFTGFPLGPVLGIYPVTHRGLVSSITPVVTPVAGSRRLTPEIMKRIRDDPFRVFQLDATAYPGNSGSPVYDPASGAVIGIINQVFVKETKESAIKDPSGITYAIPARYLAELLESAATAK